MERKRLLRAMDLFGAPEQFENIALQMVHEEEWETVLLMEDRDVPDAELRKLVLDNGLCFSPVDFIRELYHRGIINKVPKAETLTWHIGTFYCRFSFYAQYESYEYGKLPLEVQKALNEWQFSEYLDIHSENVKARMRGEDIHVHNSYFLTLEEADAFVDKHAGHIYLHACNCKSQQPYLHNKPVNVCMTFYDGPNGEPDRGHGEKLTAEQAKAKLREFNKAGLMQNGEDHAICNCDGGACCPLQMARALGSKGIYPRSHYDIDWHPQKCIHCGKCTKICNFQAFQKGEDGKVSYHKELCWGCTICAPNCPKGAIHLIDKGEARTTDLAKAMENLLNHK